MKPSGRAPFFPPASCPDRSHPGRTNLDWRRWGQVVTTAFFFLFAATGGSHPVAASGQDDAPSPDLPVPWRLPLRPDPPLGDFGWKLSAAELSPVSSSGGAVSPQPTPATTDEEVRARLAAMVNSGRPVPPGSAGSDAPDARTVTFRPLRRGESPEPAPPMAGDATATALAAPPLTELAKEIGPLEDAALAAAVRGRLAADPELSKLPLTVASQAGRVTVRPAPSADRSSPPMAGWTLEHVAAVLNVTLPVVPLVGVTVDLPEVPPRR